MNWKGMWPRLRTTVGLGFLIWMARVTPLSASVFVRVNITEAPQVTIGSSTAARILSSDGRVLAEVDPLSPLTASSLGSAVQLGDVQGDRLFLQPSTANGSVFIDDVWYRGSVELRLTDGRLMAVNHVALESYVASVIGSEMGGHFPLEALKSQAVATRTFALYNHNKRLQKPYAVGDDQKWQVYKGIAAESPTTVAAVEQTVGEVLVHNGRLINAVYHADSGGATENSEHVWTNPLPYLRAVSDRDLVSPRPWEKQLSRQDLQREIVGVGQVRSVDVVERSPQGRVRRLVVSGDAGSVSLTGREFRQRFRLKSTMFDVEPGAPIRTASVAPVATPSAYVIKGRGYGH
ncbi:MAG: SpoIID/LytB domain-containing protein, partial [Cyanobacteria bacterium J06639_1]